MSWILASSDVEDAIIHSWMCALSPSERPVSAYIDKVIFIPNSDIRTVCNN